MPFTLKGNTQGMLSAGPEIVVQGGILLGTEDTRGRERRGRRRHSILSSAKKVLVRLGLKTFDYASLDNLNLHEYTIFFFIHEWIYIEAN
jgi:hypothetical protein